jgi:hypothetical protein
LKTLDIIRAWKIIRKNVEASATELLSYYELKGHKPRFGEERNRMENCGMNVILHRD